MKIIITGGAGFLGRRLISALLSIRDSGRPDIPAFDGIISLDLAPAGIDDPRVESIIGDVADSNFLATNLPGDTVAIYHLAAVVSGQAEANFEIGMQVNLDGTRALLETARSLAVPARFLFASSLAVFGGNLPDTVSDNQALVPASSYGTQKAIGELLVSDYSRKGFIDGIALRLPTVVVRPGKPNAAASSFASSLIREPLSGVEAICPVPPQTRLWLSSPDSVVANLVHALTLSPTNGGAAINLPGISVTVAQMLESLRQIGGSARHALVKHQRDLRIESIVCSWPGNFAPERALAMGFIRDENFDDVVIQYAREFAPDVMEH